MKYLGLMHSRIKLYGNDLQLQRTLTPNGEIVMMNYCFLGKQKIQFLMFNMANTQNLRKSIFLKKMKTDITNLYLCLVVEKL